ncbi:NUDIX hydrolase [Streptomyces litchfieldiae]|uniref:NUDIX hydrolase n=1 Tax=Streptomyces litchfieldiae TaxID=3075543 RepID=A0ABU2MS07_9ACTN|nr:NUDIX hydrolase [Streptomyces sp. DSM 44938]MDT0344422.1 NUDIX hydrolase [Streptomyces sp. DSM 44938]
MTEPLLRPPGVELLDVHQLRLVETPAPTPSPEELRALNRVWDEAVRANPNLFDGPVVACAGLDWEEPHSLVVDWARTTYRFRALHRVPGATSWLPSLFVGVLQPADDARLLVGRMAPWTASPGRWQLPGGSMEPPEDHRPLDLAALRRHAARELVEETGIVTPPEDLALWQVTRGGNGNVGFLFRAPSLPASAVRERYAALVSAETALGRAPELDRIAFVGSHAEVTGLGGPHADYLEPVVRRHAA